ncbi:carbohydrate sulfotransferase 11-like isoform X2 [Pollicipes pollicipes]|nr:carbohydrate sulfotransferase 11-like isoform X2 [Pollicipes pollicipes]
MGLLFGLSALVSRPAAQVTPRPAVDAPRAPPPVAASAADTDAGGVGGHRGRKTIMRERMRLRAETMRQTCEGKPLYRAPAISDNIFYDKTHALVWCPVYKAGSTNWLKLLCRAHSLDRPWRRGPRRPCPIEVLRRHLGTIGRGWQVPPTVRHRFLVVRHPLERLLSAYRNKLEGPDLHAFYREKVARMISRHRVGRVESDRRVHPGQSPPPLTFDEFLRSVAAKDVLDEHWKPYYALCTPCNIEYDLVGKFETLAEDQRYISEVVGLEEHAHLLLSDSANVHAAGPTGTYLQKYFSQVTRDELMRVYSVFKLDFVMFNYTVDEYLKYTKPNALNRI